MKGELFIPPESRPAVSEEMAREAWQVADALIARDQIPQTKASATAQAQERATNTSATPHKHMR